MGWDDVNGSGSTGDKMEYVKLNVGTTVIRCLDTAPKSRYTHWVQQANGGKGVSVTCCGGKTCPICAERQEAKEAGRDYNDMPYNARKVHAMNVIDRADAKVKILEKGKGLFEHLASFKDAVGPVNAYDVQIIRKGEKFNEVSYTVIPKVPVALTAEELELAKYDLDELSKAWTPEQIRLAMSGATMEEIFPKADGETEGVETA